MQLPHYQMSKWALEYLLEHTGESLPPVQHTLDCPYIERESVAGPLPGLSESLHRQRFFLLVESKASFGD